QIARRPRLRRPLVPVLRELRHLAAHLGGGGPAAGGHPSPTHRKTVVLRALVRTHRQRRRLLLDRRLPRTLRPPAPLGRTADLPPINWLPGDHLRGVRLGPAPTP